MGPWWFDDFSVPNEKNRGNSTVRRSYSDLNVNSPLGSIHNLMCGHI